MLNQVCIVIPGPSFEEAQNQITKSQGIADLLEFRIDLFNFSDHTLLRKLKESTSLPIIFTLRNIFDEAQASHFQFLLSLKPNYIDMECHVGSKIFANIRQQLPDVQLICSLHDFEKTANDLDSLFQRMLQCPVNIYKIATMAQSSLDAMRMLHFVKKQAQLGYQINGFCLGEKGQFSRILGPVFGNVFTYACLDAFTRTAPGQLEADVLINTYHCKKINRSTQIFGLIGDPVEFSRSHQTHNNTMQRLGLNAIYVKIQLSPGEVETFLTEAKDLGFKGLSVTMPLKEVVGKFLDSTHGIAAEVGAVNTITLSAAAKAGYNTDGDAVAELLLEHTGSLHNKCVVLLGAGGAAKAIACALQKQGAKLIILNRSLENAQKLADLCGGESDDLSQFSTVAAQGYDVLINCTPIGMPSSPGSPILVDDLLPNQIVMDIISYPKETALLAAAALCNCITIPGEAMFFRQAEKQFSLWLSCILS